MKKALFFVFAMIVGGAGVVLYAFLTQEDYLVSHYKWRTESDHAKDCNRFIEKLNHAKTRKELRALETDLALLDSDLSKMIKPHFDLRVVKVSFEEADNLVKSAIALQSSLTLPPLAASRHGVPGKSTSPMEDDPGDDDPPPHTPPLPARDSVAIHPAAQANLNKAEALYVESKKYVDRLNDIKGNDGFNYSLNYIKGEVYHRHLMYLATQENSQDLFTQTATFYKKALMYKPGDINTVVNIELLLKNGDGGGGGQKDGGRPRMLNQMGVGRLKGN